MAEVEPVRPPMQAMGEDEDASVVDVGAYAEGGTFDQASEVAQMEEEALL